jgi:cytoskeleton protein RodZ
VLKVPERKLEALEADRYADLQSMTFVRALALSACRVMRADAAPVLAQLPQQTQVEVLDPVSTGLNRPLQEFGHRRLWGGMLREQHAGLAVTVVFVVGAVLLWALPTGWIDQLRARFSQSGGTPTTVVEEPVAVPAPLAEPIASDRLPASGVVPSWPASTPAGLMPPVALPGAVSTPPVPSAPSAPARSASGVYRSASGAWGARSARTAASSGGTTRSDTSSPAIDKPVAPTPAASQ